MSNSYEIINDFIKAHYSESEYPLTKKQIDEWRKSKPLKGKRILQNLPLMNNTLIKMLPLLASEAELTVTHFKMPGLAPSQKAINILAEAKIKYVATHEDIEGEFDIGLDCGAQIPNMKNVSILDGVIELTQTGGKIFQSKPTAYPVIDIDNSFLKNLEGMYGTGDGFVRAIKHHCDADLKNKAFVIFGFGKVGRGVAKYLSYEKANVTVIETRKSRLALAKKNGFNTIQASEKESVKSAIQEAFCVCTATGCENIIGQYIKPNECLDTWFANMGVVDEIGEGFIHPKTLCQRSPINFTLENPTEVKYLDPIFYAHNLSADLLNQPEIQPGYNAFPKQRDNVIVKAWEKIHNIDASDIYQQ